MSPETKFLDHVQVLRGLSILLVYVYHVAPSVTGSGYLGVDVFFVLSGFLMAHLYGSIATAAAIKDFYARRFWRVVPAYCVTLVLTFLMAGLFFSTANEVRSVSQQGLWSAALLPNLGFWTDVAYFQDTSYRPFLHFWSLGVEVQYYLIFPVIAWIGRRHLWLLAALAGVSLAGYALVNGLSAKTSFFITPFRLWQFLAGYAAAWLLPRVSQRWAWLGLASLCAIVLMGLAPRPSAAVTWHAVVATIAAALVIGLGLPRGVTTSGPGRGLQWLGRYAYAIYLVHYPIIAFWGYEPFRGGLAAFSSYSDLAGITALSLAAAVLLHHAIEQPFRKPRALAPLGGALVACAGVILLAKPALLAHQAATTPPAAQVLAAAALDRPDFRCGQRFRLLHPFDPVCQLGAQGHTRRNVFLIGNSHADMIKWAVLESAQAHGRGVVMTAANDSLGEQISPAWAMAEARTHNVDLIVLHHRATELYPQATADLAARATAAGIAVVMIEPAPLPGVHVLQSLSRAQRAGAPLPRTQGDLASYAAQNGAALA